MLLRNHVTNFLRSPDEPAAPEPEPVLPLVAPEPVVAAEPTPEPEPTSEPAPAPQPDKTAPKWALERLGEETNKRQEAEERERQATERAKSFEEIVKRLQANPATTPAADPARAAPIERAQPSTEQLSVEQKAAQLVFQRDVETVSNNGAKAYGAKWMDAVNALNAYGANSADFVGNVMAVDPAKAHEIMFQISQDPDKAVALVRMRPETRIAEITRMVMATAEQKPAPVVEPVKPTAVSRAPAPKPALAPVASAPEVDPMTPEGDAKMDGEAWNQWYRAKYIRKTG